MKTKIPEGVKVTRWPWAHFPSQRAETVLIKDGNVCLSMDRGPDLPEARIILPASSYSIGAACVLKVLIDLARELDEEWGMEEMRAEFRDKGLIK